MNAIELLKSQHKQVRAFLQRIENMSSADEKQSLFEMLANHLAAHATIEEEIFYPAAYENETEEQLDEAVEEHLSLKRILSDLMDMSPEDDHYTAKLQVLKEQFDHHVHKEETELFKKVRGVLDAEEIDALGEEMEELFDEEMRGEPSAKIPGQTDEAARLR